ncbi:FkbM family methyltransferase [Mesorhizobium sp.]|nr:FkbM family methyltransferase [Mesorhizobium sp.]
MLPAQQASATLFIGHAHELFLGGKAHVESYGDLDSIGGIREHIEVCVIGINELLTPYANKVDFLSLDCEGPDHDLLKGH